MEITRQKTRKIDSLPALELKHALALCLHEGQPDKPVEDIKGKALPLLPILLIAAELNSDTFLRSICQFNRRKDSPAQRKEDENPR